MTVCRRTALLAAPALMLSAGAHTEETFPSRPIRMIVPFPPGGPLDRIGRPLAEAMRTTLGQPIVFENRAGANGIIGTQVVATAAPDGYTLLITTGSFVGNMLFSPVPLPYDPARDLQPVTLVQYGSGLVLVGRPNLPAASLDQVAQLARRETEALSIAVSGAGNITQLAARQFDRMVGSRLLEVVLATGPAITEVVAGHVDLVFAGASLVADLVKEGRLRAYGYTGNHRSGLLPDVPLFTELGYPDWKLFGMTGIWTRAGTPADRIGRVQQSVAAGLRVPDVARIVAEGDSEPSGNTPAEFAAYLQREIAMQRSLAGMAP